MIKNLFKSFAKNPSSQTPRLVVIQGQEHDVVQEGEKRLREAKEELASLRNSYASGKFSGHPEEMLEAIEDYERLERVLTKAKKRGWTPDAKVVAEVEYDIQMQTEFMEARCYSPEEIASEIDWRRRKLEEAQVGLR